MNGNSASRLQYLHTRTPADDRIGRSTSPAPAHDLPISGPAFEMPEAPSASQPIPASVAHVERQRWRQPAAMASAGPVERLRYHVSGSIDRGEQAPIVEQPAPSSAPNVEPAASSAEPTPAPQPAGSIGRAFVLAGRATFTLQGKDSRYTFRVSHVDASDRGPERWFVSLLTGPDNTADYTYVGMLDASSGQLILTRKSQYTADSQPVRAFGWCMRYLWQGKELPAPARIFHMGRCGRCGRALTVPSSIESGLGPECAAKMDL